MRYKSKLDKLADHDCELCELHEYTERVCIMGTGPRKADIMILGEAPGENEAQTGRVFSGRAGQLLDLKLKEAGLDRDEVYVSNVVKCRPSDNRKPTRVEWEACRKYLLREVRAVSPRYVLLLGNSALQVVAKQSGITTKRGVRLDVRDPAFRGAEVMATIHPAYVLRNPGQDSVFSEDIKRFARLTEGAFQAVQVRTTYVRSLQGLRRLREMLAALPPGTPIAYDVETRYQPWNKDWAIVCLGMSWDGERAYVVPLCHPDSPFRKNWRKVLRYLKPALQRDDLKWIAQNGKFDNGQLAGAKVFIEHAFDIMLAAHILDENRPKNLGFLSQSVLGADIYKGMVETKPEKIMLQDIKGLARYNGYDCGYTWQIYPRLREELIAQPRSLRLFTKLLMPASHVIQKVEARGMYANQERMFGRMTKLQGMIDDQRAILEEHNPDGGKWSGKKDKGVFNYNSTQQLSRWLFSSKKQGGLGFTPIIYTDSGAASTKEAVLLHYHEHPAVQALLKYRTLQLKWMNTYILPWSTRLDSASRLHTSYKLFGTVTGRLSGDMQQVPRDPFIRSIIGAPPGWKFVQADYSQIELRIAAHVAQERRMMRAFHTGEDLHMMTAMSLTGKLRSDVTSEERKKAKAVNFGFLYGMYPKKFQSYAFESYGVEVSMGEAEVARAKFFEQYPDLVRWHDRQKRVAHLHHSVTSPIGRVRHLPDILSSDNAVRMEAERQAINSPVQSMASDLMLFSMVHLQPQLNPANAYMVGTLHDAIFFEVREEKIDEVVPIIKDTMENLPLEKTFGARLRVPVVSEVEWGQHWTEWEGSS